MKYHHQVVHDVDRVVETEVLIVGSGPTGATYARKLVDAGVKVLMVEIVDQETLIPGDHKKNNGSAQNDINSFIKVVQLGPQDVASMSMDPSAWSANANSATIHNGWNPMQDTHHNLSATTGAHWKNCTTRQHPGLERSSLFNDKEWDTLYSEAEERIKAKSTLFDDSIRQQLVLETLRKGKYEHGDRNFIPMALAMQKKPDQTYTEWSCSANIFGDMTGTADRPGNDRFKLKSQVLCTRLVTGETVPGTENVVIKGALCKDLKTGETFMVQAKKYVLCAGAVQTPGILFNSGWTPKRNQLPALGKYLTEQTMAFCQIVLSGDLLDRVTKRPDPSWAKRIAEHQQKFPSDPLPFPFSDPDPQVYTPVSEEYPWHAQIHGIACSSGQVAATVEQRLIVDLRWFGLVKPIESNHVTFATEFTDQFGMPNHTFHSAALREDTDRAHRMMADMCLVASKLGGFRPGAEPQFLAPGSELHICGTTRAGTSVKDSVCDRYGKVWGTNNLVVGGCGVIPTGNASNPTLTAMCFAIAGADKMIEEMRKAGKAV